MASYEQYYSSSDCSIFIENPQGKKLSVLLDKVRSVGFVENLDSRGMYGVGNSKLGFISQGNLIVYGQI